MLKTKRTQTVRAVYVLDLIQLTFALVVIENEVFYMRYFMSTGADYSLRLHLEFLQPTESIYSKKQKYIKQNISSEVYL